MGQAGLLIGASGPKSSRPMDRTEMIEMREAEKC